ncbi:hypothetical protein BC628DRAFT_61178 [Trametes gibbosa]|nr:hypothetical protein BC628DRAFT_61178 [Trametes gibbosa]
MTFRVNLLFRPWEDFRRVAASRDTERDTITQSESYSGIWQQPLELESIRAPLTSRGERGLYHLPRIESDPKVSSLVFQGKSLILGSNRIYTAMGSSSNMKIPHPPRPSLRTSATFAGPQCLTVGMPVFFRSREKHLSTPSSTIRMRPLRADRTHLRRACSTKSSGFSNSKVGRRAPRIWKGIVSRITSQSPTPRLRASCARTPHLPLRKQRPLQPACLPRENIPIAPIPIHT